MPEPSTAAATDGDGLRTLSRVSLLLRLLAEAQAPMPLATIAPRSGLHRATVHRLLGALVVEGLVEQTPQGYALGHQLWLLGEAAARRYDLERIATPALRLVADATGDVALLSMRTGHTARCVARVEGSHPILPMTLRVGTVRPLGCGAHALAVLAALPDADVESIIARGEDRVAFPTFDAAYLRDKVAETRAQGFALSDQDIVSGMTAVGIAIRDAWGRPLGSLSCAAITPRLEPARWPEVVALLREGVADIEAKFAGRDAAPSQ
ncbi:IclR family transcriptional regulator [Humitalea sp. 24SJ18S-53]|uniref:IclR family transcriptional regulator n=1 Tax=Humitalea sp. 24SJ18S-53 TaxID=3422307 RepID=UPI003D67C36B